MDDAGISEQENENYEYTVPAEWNGLLSSGKRKTVLYVLSAGALLQYGKKEIKKLEDTLELFAEYKDKVVLLWYPQAEITRSEGLFDPELWADYKRIENKYLKDRWGIFVTEDREKLAVQIADAAYGDPASVMLDMIDRKKPVMIQDVNIVTA